MNELLQNFLRVDDVYALQLSQPVIKPWLSRNGVECVPAK
jgi:hypothetical protein